MSCSCVRGSRGLFSDLVTYMGMVLTVELKSIAIGEYSYYIYIATPKFKVKTE